MPFTVGSTPFGTFDNDPQFQAEADKIVDYTRRKLGDPIMSVHLSSSQIYASFEEACLEFSAIVNQYQAKSTLTQLLGAPTGSLSGSENTYPSRVFEFQRKLAEPYGEEAGLNGPHTLYSGSITLEPGVQKYNLQALLSGTVGDQRIRLQKIFHFDPIANMRMFGTTSAINYLHGQIGFESFTPETIFYLLPIWEDVLRGMQFETSNRVRRSNYSFELHNNELTLYPMPQNDIQLHFTYTLPPNPGQATGVTDAAHAGVANLSNVPFGNIQYSSVNSIGRQWIRRFAFALAKETEGQIRAKMNSIPIPNGELNLNGAELITDGRQEQEVLRQELKEILDETTYDKLAAKEAELAENVRRAIQDVPLGIYIG